MTPPPLPRWILGGAAVAVAFLVVPLLGLLTRLPWPDVPRLLTTGAATDALALSLATCAAAMVASVVLGLPLALVLARGQGRLTAALRTLTALDNTPTLGTEGSSRALVTMRKVLPVWAVRLLIAALLLAPVLVAVDGFARVRRRHEPVGPWVWWLICR